MYRPATINNLRFYAALLGTYVFFLFTLPSLNFLITPCLRPIPNQSYTDAQCNVGLALDNFMRASLVGLAVMVLFYYFISGKHRLKQVFVFALVLTSFTITAYYIYIPQAEIRIKAAPIILESLLGKR